MNLQEVMLEMETMGSEQYRKTFRRHGAKDPMFGVSAANLKLLTKKIKKDHELAKKLWATGNYDARILATMIADPAQATEALLDEWAASLDAHVLSDYLAGYASKTAFAQAKAVQWSRSDEELIGRAGWHLLSNMAREDQVLPDSYFEPFLSEIESGIHSSKNRKREAMNGAIIALGVRSMGLQEKALLTAKNVGKVELDHGDTDCKTPDATQYILKTAARKQGEPAK
jgi:3-methyladenine DNA glycosylase AlkD